jgi:hypothetical protein
MDNPLDTMTQTLGPIRRYPGPEMQRRVVFPLLAVVLAGAVGLAVAEVAVRFLRPETSRAAILARIERERLPWREPDARFHHVGDGIFKLRFPEPSETSEHRVLILADSFAMGHGVGKEKRFGALLPETLVLATSSYSPIIYRNVLREALSRTSFRAVAVFVDQTDPADDITYRNDLLGAPDSRQFDVALMRDRKQRSMETYDRLGAEASRRLRSSALYNLLNPPPSFVEEFPQDSAHFRYVQVTLAGPQLRQAFNEHPTSVPTREMETLLFSHLDEIVSLCRDREVTLLLAGNPWEHHVAGPNPRGNRLEQLISKKYRGVPGVETLELTQAFRAEDNPSSLFLDRPSNESHWNEVGHAVVARVLGEALVALRSSREAGAGG